jgi:hypothetical protein
VPSKSKAASSASTPDEEAVRRRAYELWEADGRPEGRSDHYWHMAMAESSAGQAAAPAGEDSSVSSRPAAAGRKGGKGTAPPA